jgi:hypothetical protein
MGLLAIERKRGDTYPDVFKLWDKETRLPLPIPGWTFTLTVDPLENPPDATGNIFALAGVITNEAGGEVSFAPSALQADNLGVYHYDVQGADPLGAVRTIAKDTYTFVQDITK